MERAIRVSTVPMTRTYATRIFHQSTSDSPPRIAHRAATPAILAAFRCVRKWAIPGELLVENPAAPPGGLTVANSDPNLSNVAEVRWKTPPVPSNINAASESDAVLTPRLKVRTRVFVIDEKGLMRDGLCALISSGEEFEVVGTETTVGEALRNAASAQSDVFVIDFAHARSQGPELIRDVKVRLPAARVLVLTFGRDDHLIDGALRAGADGYVLKNDSCNELFTALRSIAAGKGFISPSICDRVVSGYMRTRPARHAAGRPAEELTERERQVIRLIAAGHRTREIAEILSLSHKTIEKHRSNLMRKLRLRNASAVAAYAIAHGLA